MAVAGTARPGRPRKAEGRPDRSGRPSSYCSHPLPTWVARSRSATEGVLQDAADVVELAATDSDVQGGGEQAFAARLIHVAI